MGSRLQPKIRIRPARASDVPQMATIDRVASPDLPITSAFPSAEDFHGVVVERYELFFKQDFYHFFVAEIEGEEGVVGFGAWKEAGKKEPDFRPNLPEGTNTEMVTFFIQEVRKHHEDLGLASDVLELEVLGVLPEYQRMGVGSALLAVVLKEVDERGQKIYVRASAKGKGLYAKLGWKLFGDYGMDFRRFGGEVYVTWHMMREIGRK